VLKAKLPPLQTPAATAAQDKAKIDKDRQSITSQEEHEQDFLRKLSMLSTAAGLTFGVDGLRNRKPWPIRVNHFGHMSLFKKGCPKFHWFIMIYHHFPNKKDIDWDDWVFPIVSSSSS